MTTKKKKVHKHSAFAEDNVVNNRLDTKTSETDALLVCSSRDETSVRMIRVMKQKMTPWFLLT